MAEETQQKLMRLLITSAIVLAFSGSAYLLMKLSPYLKTIWAIIWAVLSPFLISMVIAYLLNPVVNLLHGRNVPRGVAVVLIYFTFTLLFIVFLMNMIPAFITQAQDLIEHLPALTQTYQSWLMEVHTHKYELPEGIRLGIDQALLNSQQKTSEWFATALDGAGSLLQKIIHFFVIPFLVFYLLKDMKMIHRGFLLLVPREKRKNASKLLHDIDTALGNYIGGQLLVCGVVGVLAYLGFWLIGMPYALILAFFITITNIIPYIGPLIGAAPSILVALTISWKMTLFVLAVNLTVQILAGNLVSPMIMGKRLHMHPLVIILALLIGGEVGGLIGLIFAVPVFAILRVIAHHILAHAVKH